MAGTKEKIRLKKTVVYTYSKEAVKLTAEAMNLSIGEAEEVLQKLEDQARKKTPRLVHN